MKRSNSKIIRIENREHLLSTLSEASELEHNLMCLYLFAYFSLKTKDAGDLSSDEHESVKRWGEMIKSIAIQEMGHLAMVSNLTTAIGGTASFFRPNFPVKPGYYPSEFVLQLSPFSLPLLDHFIYLERPVTSDLKPAEEFAPEDDYDRATLNNRLMSHTGEYKTVGELYDAIDEGFTTLSKKLGEENLFCGSPGVQLAHPDMKMDGLLEVKSLKDAKSVISVIVEQGEGSTVDDCHFQKFIQIKKEYEELLKKNPSFKPARACVQNPVMRNPVTAASECVWINHPLSSRILDVGNALYSLMLRVLVQVYAMEQRSSESRKWLLGTAFKIMGCLSTIGKWLPEYPAKNEGEERAGLSFSIDRSFSAFEVSSEGRLIKERVKEIFAVVENLQKSNPDEALMKVKAVLETLL